MDEVTVSVLPYWGGWVVSCSVHGVLPAIWNREDVAGLDALGHGSHHHSRPALASEHD